MTKEKVFYADEASEYDVVTLAGWLDDLERRARVEGKTSRIGGHASSWELPIKDKHDDELFVRVSAMGGELGARTITLAVERRTKEVYDIWNYTINVYHRDFLRTEGDDQGWRVQEAINDKPIDVTLDEYQRRSDDYDDPFCNRFLLLCSLMGQLQKGEDLKNEV